MKIFSQTNIIIGIILLMLGGILILYFSSFEKNFDPLKKILSEVEDKNTSEWKANFLEGNLTSYNGAITTAWQKCIDESPASQQKGIVYASMDMTEINKMLTEKYQGTLTLDQIRDKIGEGFRHAYNNTQIHWEWKKEDNSYQFRTTAGKESLWYCYFTVESPFFGKAFSSVRYDVSNCTFDSTHNGFNDHWCAFE